MIDPTDLEDLARRARVTVCQNAKDAPEARDLMLMLGIHPSQECNDTLVDPGGLPTRPMNR